MREEEIVRELMDKADIAKPPVGLLPRKIHRTFRIEELLLAMQRQVSAGKIIPPEWIHELRELNMEIA